MDIVVHHKTRPLMWNEIYVKKFVKVGWELNFVKLLQSNWMKYLYNGYDQYIGFCKFRQEGRKYLLVFYAAYSALIKDLQKRAY